MDYHVNLKISLPIILLSLKGNNGPPPGKPTVRTEPRYIYSNEGESAQFICIAEGNPIPSISWKPGRGSLNNAEVRGQTLSFNRVQKSDEGDYFCVASNDYGETEERVFLYVEERGKTSIHIEGKFAFPKYWTSKMEPNGLRPSFLFVCSICSTS